MDLFKSMKAFVTTVQSGSMSAAASLLTMTPAMVGQHVAALETRLGSRLLNRTTRRQSLTPYGETYFEQCKDILERVAIADSEAEAQLTAPQGLLRITAPVTFGSVLLMPALAKYRKDFPLVNLDVILTDENVDMVEGSIDVSFRIGTIPDSRVVQRTLMPYTMIACASPGYLAKHGVPKHPSELTEYEVVRFAQAVRSSLRLYSNDITVDVIPKCGLTVNSGQALVNAAKSGLGIIIQPAILLERDISEGNLIQVLPSWQLGTRQISLLYYRHKNMAPKVRSFISFAKEEFDKRNREPDHVE
ncbi:LysR family transcriptional regulator [Vibrio sp. WJH972]